MLTYADIHKNMTDQTFCWQNTACWNSLLPNCWNACPEQFHHWESLHKKTPHLFCIVNDIGEFNISKLFFCFYIKHLINARESKLYWHRFVSVWPSDIRINIGMQSLSQTLARTEYNIASVHQFIWFWFGLTDNPWPVSVQLIYLTKCIEYCIWKITNYSHIILNEFELRKMITTAGK